MIQGSCLCGGIAFEATEQIEFRNCHCSRCRKARGAAYAANIFVKPADFRWLRGEDLARELPVAGSAPLRKRLLSRLRQPDAARRSHAGLHRRTGGRP